MPTVTSSVSVTTSVKFQQKLKENKNFGDALVEVFADLARLEIVTWVAHDGDSEHKAGNRLKTTINLIDGDIENELGADFLHGSPYAELRDFHESQVQKGAETIANNLKTLVGIGQRVTDLLNHKSEEEALVIGVDDDASDLRRDRLPTFV